MAMKPHELIEKIEVMKVALTARVTGGSTQYDSERAYSAIRLELLNNVIAKGRVPKVVRRCRNLDEVWTFIQPLYKTYAERREYIRSEFDPLLTALEASSLAPADSGVSAVLKSTPSVYVHDAWTRAIERRSTDPEGAITAARTLLESTCKLILEETGAQCEDGADLPKMYKKAARSLNLAPDQHSEQVFKQILMGCQTVVEGLGALRNRLSDAHGRGSKAVRPLPRHAELAVNLAGAAATFLVSTLEAKGSKDLGPPDRE